MERTVRVRLLNGKNEVLLVLEAGGMVGPHFKKHPGWGLPGGRMKPHENPREAAQRELLEETGFSAEIDAEPSHIEKRGEHEIWFFKAKNPVEKSAEIDSNILCARWVNPAFIYGTLNWRDESFRVYSSHLPMIHNLL